MYRLTFAAEALGNTTLIWNTGILQSLKVVGIRSGPDCGHLCGTRTLLEEVPDLVLAVPLAREIDESVSVQEFTLGWLL